VTNNAALDDLDGLVDFHQNFLEFESNLELFEWQVDGIPLWERIRIPIYRSILYSKDSTGERYNEIDRSISGYLKGASLWLRNIFFNNPFFGDKHKIVVWGHQRRKQLDDGFWWDIYTDPLLNNSDLDFQQLETAHGLTHHRPSKTKNIDYLDFITFSSTIYRKIDVFKKRIQSDKVNSIEKNISEQFDTNVNVGRLAYEELTDRRVYLPLYQRLLRRIDPEIALVVLGYSRETFIEACTREGIPTVELQHGFLGDYHVGYSLPEGIDKKHKPDYMFSFGPYWTDVVPMFDTENVFNVGYQHMENKYELYHETQETDELLFISQPTCGEELSQLAINSADNKNYSVVYKLHPEEYDIWKNKYPWLTDSSVTMVEGEVDLYELQARARVQIGVNSTALFEGLRFGTPLILFETSGIGAMNKLIMQYDIPVVTQAEEVLEVVPTLDEWSVDPSLFFSPNPSDNFKRAIKTILSESSESSESFVA